MELIIGAIGIPAFVFFVFALALGLNPARAAAWGAIVGMVAIVCFVFVQMRDDARVIAERPTFTSTDEVPVQAPAPAHRPTLVPVEGDPFAQPAPAAPHGGQSDHAAPADATSSGLY